MECAVREELKEPPFKPRDFIVGKHAQTLAEVRAHLVDDVTHNTALKMLSILEAKGYVGHVEEGRARRFHALVAREAAGTSAFGRLVDKMFGGSAVALLSHFVQDRRLTRAELERVRSILDARLNTRTTSPISADAGPNTSPHGSRPRRRRRT